MKPKNIKPTSKLVNFWWTISLLSVVIIGCIAFFLTDRIIDAHVILEYISYASVILSITLSVFAILYTYTSNVQIQQQFEKINSAANRIRDTSDNLIATNVKLNDSLNIITERLGNIDRGQSEIRSQLTNLNDQIPNSIILNNSES